MIKLYLTWLKDFGNTFVGLRRETIISLQDAFTRTKYDLAMRVMIVAW